MAGAWQLHPLGIVWKRPDYTIKVNLIDKALDYNQFGGTDGVASDGVPTSATGDAKEDRLFGQEDLGFSSTAPGA